MAKKQDSKETITGSRPKIGVFKTTKERTTVGGVAKPYKYTTESVDTSGYGKGKKAFKVVITKGESDKTGFNKIASKSTKVISRKEVPSTLSKMKKK